MDHDRRPQGGAYLSVACAAAMWGTWTLFLHNAHVDARWQTALVFAAMAGLGAPLLLRSRARTAPDGRARTAADLRWLVALGVSDAANAALFFGALSRTSVAIATLSHYLAPALVSLLAPTIARSPPQRGALLRAVVGTAGLLLVLEPWHLASSQGQPIVGAMLGAGSAVFYALNVCITKRIATRYTAEEQLVYHSAVSFPVVAAVALATGAPIPGLAGAARVLAAGAIVGVSAAVLFARGVARVPAEHASVLTLLEPLTAVLIGAFVFRESLGLAAIVGAGVVVGVGVWATRAPAQALPAATAGPAQPVRAAR